MIAIAIRAVAYASVFVGFLLVYLPARTLASANVTTPSRFGVPQAVGSIVTAIGALLAVWCIGTFVVTGRGTPAPFDPPRRLVVRGPYAFVRNPMYLGAALALTGAAMFYSSLLLLGYAAAFLLLMHLFVVWYEEPTLRQTFGNEYDAYCHGTRRWWPRWWR